jgi:hypothetical protein
MKIETEDAVARAMDWLAQLRDEGSAEPPREVGGQPAADAAPPVPVRPVAAEPLEAGPSAAVPLAAVPPVPVPRAADAPLAAEPLAPLPPVPVPRAADVPPADQPNRRVRMRTRVEITERAAIGDELRIPIAWCEMGSCISHHEDPVALGEADIRARAVAAGWRVDALGRLACPKCQQSDSWFWAARPVALWDRDTAVTMTTLMAAAARERATTHGPPEAETGIIPDVQPTISPSAARGRHREHPGRPGRGRGEGSRGSDQTA